MTAFIALGRILFVILFIVSGISKLLDIPGTAASISQHLLDPYVSLLAPLIAQAASLEDFTGLKLPQLLALASGAFETLGGLLIAFNLGARWVALLMAVFVALATAVYHDFWHMAGGERVNNMIEAMKNMSLIGALLIIAGLPQTSSLPPPATPRFDDV